MAKEIPGFTYTLPASVDLSTKMYHGILRNASGQAAVCGAAVRCMGVLQNDECDAVGKACTIMKNGITKGIAGAAIVADGTALEMDADGKFVTLAAGVRCGWIFGTAAADGDIITVLLD